jgi:hypothetical protein
MIDLISGEGATATKTVGYDAQFRAIWRRRFREFMKVHPQDVEQCVKAEWQRFRRNEPSHWFGDGETNLGWQNWEK